MGPIAIPSDAVLVAIDIAKVRNEILIETSLHKRRRHLSVLNTRAEHDRFDRGSASLWQAGVCAFEATSDYHRHIAWRLIAASFEVRLVSSYPSAESRGRT
jgi:hypothetical protein